MDGSYDDTMREAKEGSGLTRGGERFRQEKRKRKGESLAAIKMKDRERRTHETKKPYNDEGDEKAIPEPEERPTKRNNVPTPPCTAA